MSFLDVRHLVKDYCLPSKDPVHVLRDLSFAVDEGEHVAIVGRSGGGKTTLLNLLGGLDVPTSGDVLLDGKSLFIGRRAAQHRTRMRATQIGFVFQSFHLMNELDIVENVLLPTFTGEVKRAHARARAIDLLARVGLTGRLDHLPSELSGGEQQRVALARALMCEPRLVLADEPTGNLDALTGAEILNLLFSLKTKPFTCVMVTHSLQAAQQCTRTLTLEAGQLHETTRI